VKKADEILSRLLDKGPAGAQPFHSLFGGWQELAGESLAEHCRAYEVRHRCLLVEADHPGWMQLLLMQKKAILARIRQRFPQLELRDIKVRMSATGGAARREPALAAAPAPQDGEPARPPATGPASAEVEQALAAVSDPELRRKLQLLLQEMERRIDTRDRK
jgi:predicted nucleic acid-binding Zn ribbon protein